ncbi:MAG: hypothetical protein RIE52_00060 [Balneola sp.]|jgi:hypothetical protein
MEKEFSIEYSLKWGAVISIFIRYGLFPIMSLVWILTIIIVDINMNTIIDVLIVSGIFLFIGILAFIENFRKEILKIEKGFLVIQTMVLSKKKIRKYNLEEIDSIDAVPKEYMWNKIYGRENPSYVRYKMSFRYREKEIFFADGLDHKSAFYVLSKMKENPILEEKLK